MRKPGTIALLLMLCSIPVHTAVSGSPAEQIVEKTRKLYEDCDDLRMSFREKITSSFFSKIDSTQGEILMKKPDRFILREERQEIVYDGDTLWIYNKRDNQVLKSRSYSGAPFAPEEFLKAADHDYKLTGEEVLQGRSHYVLRADSLPQLGISEIVLWVDEENHHLRKLSYRDEVDNQAEFIFDTIEFNLGLKEEEFNFIPPPGVEIIDW
jgi:outer membrane lipoprotein carrier protein